MESPTQTTSAVGIALINPRDCDMICPVPANRINEYTPKNAGHPGLLYVGIYIYFYYRPLNGRNKSFEKKSKRIKKGVPRLIASEVLVYLAHR